MVGKNGVGKSTALKGLAEKLKPNLGRFNVCYIILYLSFDCFSDILLDIFLLLLQNRLDWQEILTYFRRNELQNYFTSLLEDNLKVLVHLMHQDANCWRYQISM